MCAAYYIRFATDRAAPWTRGATFGLFGPAYEARDSGALPDWLRAAIGEEIGWFEANLAVPSRFGVVTRRSDRAYGGVCWFRDAARDAIRHADTLAALVIEAGAPLTRLVSESPGDIVWRDDQQIVAMPRRRRAISPRGRPTFSPLTPSDRRARGVRVRLQSPSRRGLSRSPSARRGARP